MEKKKIISKLKIIGKSLKHYITLIIITGIILTFLFLYYSEKIPNLSSIAELWTILTIFIVLLIQFKRERKKTQKEKNTAISQIEYLIYFMYKHNENLLKLQKETRHILSILRSYYTEILSKINCHFDYQSNLIINVEKQIYLINPVEIRKYEKGIYTTITINKEEIESVIKKLEL